MNESALHVAIIMDGNGRWALQRQLPRLAGHRAGADRVRAVVRAAADHGVQVLTLYAFSSNNWSRPQAEVSNLMRLLQQYLIQENPICKKHGIRVNVIGRRDRLAPGLVNIIQRVEKQTCQHERMNLRLAVDYSATHSIASAAAGFWGRPDAPRGFADALASAIHSASGLPPVDLLVRTGGEKRLSDFLLWECAYTELWFTDTLWPDFTSADLESALCEYGRRERRFGALGKPLDKNRLECAGP